MQAEFREDLVKCCKKLRLSSALAERAEVTEGATHVEFLYNLFVKKDTFWRAI